MASQQSATRVTRGTVKRSTLGGDAQAPVRGQTPLDAAVHLPAEDATQPMDFGTDGDSDEECASALEFQNPEGVGNHPPPLTQADKRRLEYSDDGNAPVDDSQGHLMQTAASSRLMPVPGEEHVASAETDYESALSDGEDDTTVVDVATRETFQQPPVLRPQQGAQTLRQQNPETSVSPPETSVLPPTLVSSARARS